MWLFGREFSSPAVLCFQFACCARRSPLFANPYRRRLRSALQTGNKIISVVTRQDARMQVDSYCLDLCVGLLCSACHDSHLRALWSGLNNNKKICHISSKHKESECERHGPQLSLEPLKRNYCVPIIIVAKRNLILNQNVENFNVYPGPLTSVIGIIVNIRFEEIRRLDVFLSYYFHVPQNIHLNVSFSAVAIDTEIPICGYC